MRKFGLLLLALLLFSARLMAQHEHPNTPEEKPKDKSQEMHHVGMVMEGMQHGSNPASEFLMNEGAGTALNAKSVPMSMPMRMMGTWHLMSHGYAFLNSIQQTGPRGDNQVFSTNHLMLIAQREFNQRSTFFARTMLSLEPATIVDRRYPLLFQTGETAFGKPIVDGQHPHDLFMEISAQYVLAFNTDTLVHFYGALIGDPALGPVAYPHRISAQELPQATLSHHLQDSTHIASDVITAGFKYKWARAELSGFHGREPDEERWNIDQGSIDSWSTRFTLRQRPILSVKYQQGI